MAMLKQPGRITVKCVPAYCSNEYEVSVFNAENRLIFRKDTSRDGIAVFEICSPGDYRIRVRARRCLSPQAANRWLHLCPGRPYHLYFLFHSALLNPGFTEATFRLTDRNYGGLPIEKGEIQLWRVPM